MSQSFERPELYGASARLAIRPSQPARHASANRRSESSRHASVSCSAASGRIASAQAFAALEQRPAGEILAVDREEVEDAVDDRVRGHLLRGGPGGAETLLEPAERGLLAVVGDDLAVDQQLARSLVRQRVPHLGVGAGQILAGARLEPHLAAVLVRDAALAVELALEQPVVAEVAAVRQGRQHQRYRHPGILPRWKTTRARPRTRPSRAWRPGAGPPRRPGRSHEPRIVVGRQPREHGVERGPVGRVERRQELAFDALDDLAEGGELFPPGGSQADDVAAAVAGIATALDQSMFLERVEQPDQLAAVELQGVGDRRLRVAGALLEQREDRVVVRAEPGLLELLERPGLDRHAQSREQERRAREQLGGHAVRE